MPFYEQSRISTHTFNVTVEDAPLPSFWTKSQRFAKEMLSNSFLGPMQLTADGRSATATAWMSLRFGDVG